MAGTIATFLASSVTFSSADLKGNIRHAYNELVDQQTRDDPDLASPYLKASANSVIAATAGSSGNFTITMNFPKYGVAVTTGNVVYNASVAAVQTLKASGAGIISGNALTLTANGTTVNGAAMVVTTTNVDLDVAAPAVTAGVIGTMNRPGEAILKQLNIVQSVSGTVAVQGIDVAEGDYETVQDNGGYNPWSIAPGTLDLIVDDIAVNEDKALALEFRRLIGSI
jgi:hypothetical protein